MCTPDYLVKHLEFHDILLNLIYALGQEEPKLVYTLFDVSPWSKQRVAFKAKLCSILHSVVVTLSFNAKMVLANFECNH